MYEEPEKLNDNDALNQILENTKSINKKLGLFYWLVILGIILLVINAILPHVSMA